MIKIDKDVPLPNQGRWMNGLPKYPTSSLEPGDSFFTEGARKKSIQNHLSNMRSRYSDRAFEYRAVPGGYRIWRTR